jgi:hypothetical protein
MRSFELIKIEKRTNHKQSGEIEKIKADASTDFYCPDFF